MARIGWLSDLDSIGSGYQNLSLHYCNGLVKLGHEVKVIGFQYNGEEHRNPFSIIPAHDFKEVYAIVQNFVHLWDMEALVVAFDIPLQERIIGQFMQMGTMPFKYIGVMPIESDPLCVSWGMVLMQMDKALVISHFGVEEAKKVGVEAEYLEVGVDTELWKPLTPDERKYARDIFGISQDAFVMLTVADNQERKNLWASLEAFQRLVKEYPDKDLKYVLVTRPRNYAGFRLDDLAQEFGISDKVMLLDRGISREELRNVYGMSDVFVLPSKAEGLGLPLLEAMSCGIPCMATDCTGMRELLKDNRGYLIPPIFIPRDPFGNGRRYWIDVDALFSQLFYIVEGGVDKKIINRATKFVHKRSWETGSKTLDKVIREITTHEEKTHDSDIAS